MKHTREEEEEEEEVLIFVFDDDLQKRELCYMYNRYGAISLCTAQSLYRQGFTSSTFRWENFASYIREGRKQNNQPTDCPSRNLNMVPQFMCWVNHKNTNIFPKLFTF